MPDSPNLGPLRWLSQPYAHRIITVIGVLLAGTGMMTRFALDDHVLAVKAAPATRMQTLPAEALSLFTFTTGDPTRNLALMDEGTLLPWWSEPRHLNAFFRPLSALSHVLDFRLWPSSSALMHLHSLLWYAALLLALAHVYRVLEPARPTLCACALLLYAIDDAHGATVGWVANRNALISATLALPALSAHHRWVAQGFAPGAWLGPLCVALGLCAGETALCVLGYLAAYTLCIDSRPRLTRVLSLLPYAALLFAHRFVYHALSLGSFGSSAYHDPLTEPFAFATMLAYNLPVLLSAELFVPVADLPFWTDVSHRPALLLWCLASLTGIAWLAWGGLRRDAHARFWTLGMTLSAVPLSASLPGERLLLVLGLGGAPLLARLWAQATSGGMLDPARKFGLSLVAVVHLVAAPLGLPLRSYFALEPLARESERLDASLPSTPEIRDKTVVVLSAPINVMLSYLQPARAARGLPRPAHLYWLSSASSETRVTRSGPRTLRVEQARGFLLRPEETHYRSDSRMPVGTRVALSQMHVRIAEVMPDGRPRVAEFNFAEVLESPRYLFRIYQAGTLVAWRVPRVGFGITLPAQEFFRLVAAEVLR